MKTPLSAKVLLQVLDARGWNQNGLADRAHVHRATVSLHLSRTRPIRDEHLLKYLAVLDQSERQMLLAAWIRDTASPEVVSDLLDVARQRVRPEVADWSPSLSVDQRALLNWWSGQLARDPELAALFRSLTVLAGYSSP